MRTLSPTQMKLLWGVFRRMFLHLFRPRYVRKRLSQRLGECQRCGVCCQLGWQCRYLLADDCGSSCRLYAQRRPPNCRTFPIDHRDLADRDLISPNTSCGFSWEHNDKDRD